MTLPDLLADAVATGGEEVVARVPLGGEDLLVVTPSRTLVYRAEGLLSDEAVEEYGHDAERIDVSEGRRKATITLDYGLDGERELTVPGDRLDDALHPVLAGVFAAAGITDPGESALRTFRFSDLTLVVTSRRLVKHVGPAVFDEEFEEFPYENVTDLDFEEGSVATAVVLTTGDRRERFKAPNERARAVREALVDAVCEFHGVASVEEFRVTVGDDEEDDPGGDPADFGHGPEPLSAAPSGDGDGDADPGPGAGTDAGRGDVTGASATGRAGTGTETGAGTGTEGDADGSRGLGGPSPGDRPGDGTVSGSGAGSGASAGDRARSGDAGGQGEIGSAAAADGGAGRVAEAGCEPAARANLAEEVAELRTTVERQSERLDRQADLLERLIEELKRGR
jgi:hypothetical protein